MRTLIDAAFSRSRTVLLLLLFAIGFGAASYVTIPKESAPDVPIPVIYVSVALDGISPDDSERLLIRPLETELQSVDGLAEMNSFATEGRATVSLEFTPGFDADRALDDVRQAVDRVKTDLPADADEPSVNEVNVALFPVLTAVLSGPVPERTLVRLARDLEDRIEGQPGVLEVDIAGDREEMLEIIVEPIVLETYDISFERLIEQVRRNNRLVAAGALDTGAGRMVLKVPGVIEDIDDVLDLPVKVEGDTVVSFRDVAVVRRTFRDPVGFARVAGQPALALEVKKQVGANIIETVEGVRAAVETARADWPDTISVQYQQDESEQVRTMLGDLENNVLVAILLVVVVIVATLGVRSSLLVGLAIPGSFLAAIAVLSLSGFTLNIVVLFSLILTVGMLVDGAIVTTELADRRMADGVSPREAYASAAHRMAWPIIASTATTLAVFLPLLFWPGAVGEFMKYLPITVLITLSASLLMALVFVPVLGGLIGRPSERGRRQQDVIAAAERGDLDTIGGFTGAYLRVLRRLVARPAVTLGGAVVLLIGTYAAYGQFGRGVEFFPSIEPDFMQVQVQARDNLSIREKDDLVRQVERRVMGMEGIRSVYARTIGEPVRGQQAEDVVGIVQLELEEWDRRRPAAVIGDDIRAVVEDIPGVRIQVREQEMGPGAGRPVQLRLASRDPSVLDDVVAAVRALMDAAGGFVDVVDSRPLPGVEWRLEVDRAQAARFGADVTLLGQAVQLLTVGIPVAEYRPDDADDEVDIRVRFPVGDRTLEQLDQLRIPTERGLVPIHNFVEFRPAPKTGTIERIDGERVMTIQADVATGMLVADRIAALDAAIRAADLPPGVEHSFAGEAEDQAEAARFLATAFVIAVFLMLLALTTQFNSIYQALLVLSAIVFSTAGVLLGLMVTGRPFGIVMGGLGVIALAGIVVNNNIVLIDTYNDIRRRGADTVEAVLRTCAQRLRPVLLTSVTTILGLMPMVLAMNVDLVGRKVAFGSPSTQWWTELSSSIAGGLAFATVLTLVLTPALLVLGERLAASVRRRAGRGDALASPAE